MSESVQREEKEDKEAAHEIVSNTSSEKEAKELAREARRKEIAARVEESLRKGQQNGADPANTHVQTDEEIRSKLQRFGTLQEQALEHATPEGLAALIDAYEIAYPPHQVGEKGELCEDFDQIVNQDLRNLGVSMWPEIAAFVPQTPLVKLDKSGTQHGVVEVVVPAAALDAVFMRFDDLILHTPRYHEQALLADPGFLEQAEARANRFIEEMGLGATARQLGLQRVAIPKAAAVDILFETFDAKFQREDIANWKYEGLRTEQRIGGLLMRFPHACADTIPKLRACVGSLVRVGFLMMTRLFQLFLDLDPSAPNYDKDKAMQVLSDRFTDCIFEYHLARVDTINDKPVESERRWALFMRYVPKPRQKNTLPSYKDLLQPAKALDDKVAQRMNKSIKRATEREEKRSLARGDPVPSEPSLPTDVQKDEEETKLYVGPADAPVVLTADAWQRVQNMLREHGVDVDKEFAANPAQLVAEPIASSAPLPSPSDSSV
jgi:hypothetical protein